MRDTSGQSMALKVDTETHDRWGQPLSPHVYPGTSRGYLVKLPASLSIRPRWFANKSESIEEIHGRAVAYRDRFLPASHKGRVRRQELRGVVGPRLRGPVKRQTTRLGKPGLDLVSAMPGIYDSSNLYVRAIASNATTGHRASERFSVRTLGFDTALRYAIRKRLSWERALYAYRSPLTEHDWHRFISLCYAQFKGRSFELSELKHPGCVHRHPDTCQADVCVDNVAETACFTVRQYATYDEAHAAAILWCIDNYSRRNPSGSRILRRPTARNKTTDQAGVNRRLVNDGRGHTPLVIYEAGVRVNGKRRPIRFSVGRVGKIAKEHERFAYIAACHCRQAYEACHDTGIPFDPSRYNGWKQKFGFPAPPEPVASAAMDEPTPTRVAATA